MASLVAVAIYHEPSEAAVARSCLDAHGLIAVLPEWHHGSVAWHHAYALHGLRLLTLDAMAAEARELLGAAAADGHMATTPEPRLEQVC